MLALGTFPTSNPLRELLGCAMESNVFSKSTDPLKHVILIAEDEEVLRMILTDFLGDAGFVVVEAANAADALAVLDSKLVDLVFTDIQMPGVMDGIALAAWLLTHRPGLPVILTSGRAKPFLDGSNPKQRRFISKPYALDELEKQIRNLLH